MRKPAVLLVGQTPPPYHGQAVATQILFENDWSGGDFDVHCLRMAYSSGEGDVGRFSPGKVLHLFFLIGKTWSVLLANRPCLLYYPPASPNLVPVLRDIVYLLSVRPFARGVVFHYHAGGLPEYVASRNFLLRFFARFAYSKADMRVEISRSHSLDSFGAKNTRCVPNGLDVPPFEDNGEESCQELPRIFYMAGLRRSKGVLDLIDTVKLLKNRGLGFVVDIAGCWQEEDTAQEFERMVSEDGLQNEIMMHGRVTGEGKWSLYRRASAFFFPSFYESENFPLVLIEAMAFGLPVVATRWRGIPEMVVDGETGVLCDVHDNAGFADALERLMGDAKTRADMSHAASQRYESLYTKDVFVTGIRDALSATLAEATEVAGFA